MLIAGMFTEDRCLRLRNQQTSSGRKVFVTHKGPRQKGLFKRREEIEFPVDRPEDFEQLLKALGYQPAMVVEKKRRVWQIGDCEVALDDVKLLGCYVEIEGPDEKKISEIQESLGLADLPHIQESYACLINKKHER